MGVFSQYMEALVTKFRDVMDAIPFFVEKKEGQVYFIFPRLFSITALDDAKSAGEKVLVEFFLNGGELLI